MRRSLLGQTVVVIGGASGVGLAIARGVKAAEARLILADAKSTHLEDAAEELGAEATTELDPRDAEQVDRFLVALPAPVDHVVLWLPDDGATEGGAVGRGDGLRAIGGSVLLVDENSARSGRVSRLLLDAAAVRVNRIVVENSESTLLDDRATALVIAVMIDPSINGRTYHIRSR